MIVLSQFSALRSESFRCSVRRTVRHYFLN